MLTVFSSVCFALIGNSQVMNFKINTEWNNRPIKHPTPAEITLSWNSGDVFLTAVFDAPFFDDPKAPNGPPGKPFPKLWDYEGLLEFLQ